MGSALPQTDRVPRRGRGARSAARPTMGHSTRSESAGYSSRSGRCGTARPIRTCGFRHPGKARRRIATFCTLVRRGREFGRATIRGRRVRRAFGHLGCRTTGPTEEVPDKHSRKSGRFSLQNGEFRAYTRRNADHMGRSPYSPLRTLPARQSSFNVARSRIAKWCGRDSIDAPCLHRHAFFNRSKFRCHFCFRHDTHGLDDSDISSTHFIHVYMN